VNDKELVTENSPRGTPFNSMTVTPIKQIDENNLLKLQLKNDELER
jgi:hypothetical protein